MSDPELEAVESALNTLALADSDAALQKVLTPLLPALLSALSTPSAPARAKIISSLQHINIRVRAAPSIRLPFAAILTVTTSPTAAPITTNFAIQGAYLQRAFATLPLEQRPAHLPSLLVAATKLSQKNAASVHALATDALLCACRQIPSAAGNSLIKLVDGVPENAVAMFLDYAKLALGGRLTSTPSEPHLVAFVRFCSEFAGIKQPAKAALVFPHLLLAAGSAKTALADAGEGALKKLDGAEVLAAAEPRVAGWLFELFLAHNAEVGLRMILLAKGLLRVGMCASCFPEVAEVVSVSLVTPGVPTRLQALGMQFLSFVVAHAEEGVLEENWEGLVQVLMRVLRNDTRGSPSFSHQLRAFGFTGLAELVCKVPVLMGRGGITEALFFEGAVDGELPAEMRVAASQALVMMARVIRVERNDESDRRRLLLETLFKTVEMESDAAASARAAAVQWANECFDFADCDARMVNIVAAADMKQDIRQNAEFGLGSRRWKRKDDQAVNDYSTGHGDVPGISDMVTTYKAYSRKRLRPKSLVAYLFFALSCLRRGVAGEGNLGRITAKHVATYLGDHSDDLNALKGLMSTANEVMLGQLPSGSTGTERATLTVILFSSKVDSLRTQVSEIYSEREDLLLSLIEKKSASGDTLVARAVSQLVGIAAVCLTEERLYEFVKRLSEDLEPNPSGISSGRHEEDRRVAKILSLGQVIAHTSHRADMTCGEDETNPISLSCMHIIRRISVDVESSDVVRTAACVALADIGVKSALPVPLTFRTLAIHKLSGVLMLHSSSPRLVEAAADAIGRICVGEPRVSFKKAASAALLGVCKARKEEEVRFTAAESLVRCASGFDAPPPASAEVKEAASLGATQMFQAEDLLSVMEIRIDQIEIREEVEDSKEDSEGYSSMTDILKAVMDLSRDERPNARAGGCVCLFTFLRLLGTKNGEQESAERELHFKDSRDKARFRGRRESMEIMLPQVQQAFAILLGDRSDFVQQLASCGVALVYEMCPAKEQRDLVSSLVLSLTAGKSRAASTVPGDQGTLLELGGIDTKESAGSGRAATYKELCSIAQDMGQPELVYKFMDLAGHTALWNSRRGAALAGSALLDSEVAAEQLRPHVKSLLPRLYIYCYDPADNVRMAMGSVLNAVVKAAKFGTVAEALTANYDLVIEHCLKSMSSRQWRTREAACGALRDAMVSRTWDEVKDLLKEFWFMTLRALDDIKESVRKAAGGTGRSLSELSVHLCDPKQVGVEVAESAVAVVIPSLLSAFTHAVEEVRHLAAKTLNEVIRSGGRALISSIPELVGALLEAATELEPQVLNYAEFHVPDREELQNMRVGAASMSSSPLVDSLERLAGFVEESIIERLVVNLVRLSRVGVGIPTRAATARFFATIIRSRAIIVQPFASKLMNAAAAAAGIERNSALRNLWCTAMGGAAKLASTTAVGKLVEKIVELSGSEDAQERSLSSFLAVGLWSNSPDTARKHASAMLPIAYMGRFETDEDAKGAGGNWKEVWSEGAPSTEAGLRMYAGEITAICERRLSTSAQYRVKRSAAVTLGALAAASNESVNIKHLSRSAKALLDALPGHIWDGKIAALEALGTIALSYPSAEVWETCDGANTVVLALLRESQRGKKDFRMAAIAAATKVLNTCHAQYDLFSSVYDALSDLWKSDNESIGGEIGSTNADRIVWETGSDASAVDARNRERKAKKALCIAAVTCLEASYTGESNSQCQVNQMGLLVSVFESIVKGDWEIRLGALHALRRAVSRTGESTLLPPNGGDEPMLLSRVALLAEIGITDAKYAAIRSCAMEVLTAVAGRVEEIAKVRDRLYPSLVAALKSCRAKDPDPSTQAAARKVCDLYAFE